MRLITQRGKPREYKDLDSGREFYSISQVRKVMDDTFRHAKPAALEAARARGNALHLRFALALGAKAGLCPYPEVNQFYPGQCRAMDTWVERTDFEVFKIEEPAAWLAQHLAGTPENKLRIKGVGLAIVDLKTGGKTRTDVVQLMLNQKLAGFEDVTSLIDLYVNESGTPDPVEQKFDPFAFAAAMSALNLLKWRLTR